MNIKNFDITSCFNGRYFYLIFLRLHAYFLDVRIGGKSLHRTLSTPYLSEGANKAQSTDYRLLKTVFNSVKLNPDDVFVDVGCGEGRVLSYLLLCKKFKGKLIGVEIDEHIASFTAKRFQKRENVQIIHDSIFDCMPKDASIFYLGNSFQEEIFLKFIDKIEHTIDHKILLIYVFDIYHQHLMNRKGWKCLNLGIIKRAYANDVPASLFQYEPVKNTINDK